MVLYNIDVNIYEDIRAYQPYNEQERCDKKNILAFLEKYDDAFLRSNELGHMTASAWVVNEKHDKVLMAYHRIYDSWAWLGGHCDGDEDCLRVALREVAEEAGISEVQPLSEKIFSLEILGVNSHIRKGVYVPSHLHLNVTYLLQADEKQPLHIKADENKGVAWFFPDEALDKTTEEWFKVNIYAKLCRKVRDLYEDY